MVTTTRVSLFFFADLTMLGGSSFSLARAPLLPHSSPLRGSTASSTFRIDVPWHRRTQLASVVCCAAQLDEALLWFKADLRVHDHPGLHSLFSESSSDTSSSNSSSRPRVRALFVMDPDVYKSVVDTRDAAEALASAVASLGVALRRLGVPFEVRFGRWAEVVPEVVRESSATSVVCERECSGAFAQGVARVAAGLSALKDDVDMDMWDCLLFDGYDADLEAFPVWKRMRVQAGEAARPLDVPCRVEGGQSSPTSPASQLLTGEEIWSAIEELRNDATVHTDEASAVALFAASSEAHAWECLEGYLGHDSGLTPVPDMLSDALMSYDGDDQTIDGCYPAVFNRALYATGVLSRRQVHEEALRYLVENGDTSPYDEAPLFRGPLSWLGWMLTSSGGAHAREKRFRRAKAALNGAIQQDFHLGHSYRRDGMRHTFGATTRHWRWRGVLTDYLAAEGDEDDEAREGDAKRPAIVLVHGFGAFGEHWRRNVRELADMGYDVYAPTFPGYGRSEKMSMQYGQDLWRDFLADFISEIVGRPVVIAGNSIGGYISASVAADFPQLIKGLVLLNSAGQINEEFQPRQYEIDLLQNPRQPPPVVVVDAISTLLFSFLEGDIENQLQRLYPTRPGNADEWLGKEIRRASEDPKALGVFRSVFFLPSPRPLNHLINEMYRGRVMVLQGVLDPLNDATKRAAQIVGACPQAELVSLEAGHCPHDEVPELVNAAIGRFAGVCFSSSYSA